MDIESVSTFINGVGFPIAMCVAMMFFLNKTTESHKEEVNSMKETLNENSKILAELKQLLSDYLKGGSNDKD